MPGTSQLLLGPGISWACGLDHVVLVVRRPCDFWSRDVAGRSSTQMVKPDSLGSNSGFAAHQRCDLGQTVSSVRTSVFSPVNRGDSNL